MWQSKKTKWGILIFILLLIFITFSVYRYQQVNRPFISYAVIEKMREIGKPFSVQDLTYTFGKPQIKELAHEIQYNIPVEIENKTKEVKGLRVERFIFRSNTVNNQLDLERFLARPENKDIKQGISPNSSRKVILTFSMQKEWGINKNTKANVYYLDYNGMKTSKYKLSLVE